MCPSPVQIKIFTFTDGPELLLLSEVVLADYQLGPWEHTSAYIENNPGIYCMSVANARSYHQSIAPCTVCCYLHPMKDIVLTDIGAYKLRLPAPFAKSL